MTFEKQREAGIFLKENGSGLMRASYDPIVVLFLPLIFFAFYLDGLFIPWPRVQQCYSIFILVSLILLQ